MKRLAQFVAFVIGTFIVAALRSGDGNVSIGDLLLWSIDRRRYCFKPGWRIIQRRANSRKSKKKIHVQSIPTPPTQAISPLGSLIGTEEDHLPESRSCQEMHDMAAITAQDYDTQKAEHLSRLVSEPTFTTQTAVSQQATVIQPTITLSNKSPIGAAILSFFLLGGAGQIYLGQWKKGLVSDGFHLFTKFRICWHPYPNYRHRRRIWCCSKIRRRKVGWGMGI